MAKDGFRVVDSDMHVMEPHDLWQNYIDPSYKDRAPMFRGDPLSQGFANRWHVEGKVFPAHFGDQGPNRQPGGSSREHHGQVCRRPRSTLRPRPRSFRPWRWRG